MIPAVIGAAAVSGGLQYYNSEKARAAEKRSRGEIERLYDGLSTQIPDADEIREIYDGMIAEGYDEKQIAEMLTYAGYEYAGDVIPSLAPFMQEVNPTLINESEDSLYGRDAIKEAMRKYKAVADGGFDPELDGALADIEARSNADMKSARASIEDQFARRGQLGTTKMLASQMMSQQDSQSNAAAHSRDAAIAAYKNRLNALDQSASLGGKLGDQDFKRQSANADYINSYNARNAAGMNKWAQDQSNTINTVNTRNRDARQNVLNDNTDTFNKQTYDRYKANVNERDRTDDLQIGRIATYQDDFNNKKSIVDGKAGRMGGYNQTNAQNTRDQNGMVQGVTDAFIKWNQNENEEDWREKNYELDKKYGPRRNP